MAIRTRTLKGGRKAYDVLLRRPDGTQYAQTFYTKREAETWEAQQKADKSRNRWVDPAAGRILFREYAKEWMGNRPKLAPKTRELYEQQLRCHVLPTFGDTPLNRITRRQVRAWHAGLVVSGSQVLAAKCYRLLTAIMNTAADDELVGGNPCRIKGAGAEKSPERPLATVKQALAIAEVIDQRYRALVLLAAFCGLRLGEVLGLTRADLDLLHRRVSITKQRQELGTGIALAEPKSEAGIRRVSIPAEIVPDLQRHLAKWAQPGLVGALFTGPRGGFRRSTFYKAWREALGHKAVKKAGVDPRLRPHDLRHLANVLAARVPGTTTKDLMARIGHASAAASLRYQHATEDADRAMAAGIDAAIRAATDRPARAGRVRRAAAGGGRQ